MDDRKLGRALTWVGAGGTALATTTLAVAGIFALTPDGKAPLTGVLPCSWTGCGAQVAAVTDAATGPEVGARAGSTSSTTRVATAAPTHGGVSSTVPAAPPVWYNGVPNIHLAAPVVGVTSAPTGGLVLVAADGGAFPLGPAAFHGSVTHTSLAGRIVGAAATPTGGYWMVGRDGGVFAFRAPWHGSASHLHSPVVGMAATPSGNGYLLASADGGVFAFGDARFRGSLSGHHLVSPIVAIAETPSGDGYLLVAADGGVFAFGDAPFRGSLNGHRLASPIVAAAVTPSGRGYLLASADGGVFAFGDAHWHGSASRPGGLPSPVTSLAVTTSGNGYWIGRANGTVSSYGDATRVLTAVPPAVPPAPASAPVVKVATATPPAGPQLAPLPPKKQQKRAAPARTHTVAKGRQVVRAARVDSPTYRPRSAGMDISQYQCGGFPGHQDIQIVQVTGGAIDNAPNSCYVQEARWAGRNLSAYIYLDGLPKNPPPESLNGPGGHCAPTNEACESVNYGYNWARHWVSYSRSVGSSPSMWWIDVERNSGWREVIANQLVIRGALAGLESMGVRTGIYSSATQWQEITGNMAVPGVDEWVPGAGQLSGPGYTATSFCADPGAWTFGGGHLTLVQYGYSGPFPGSYPGTSAFDRDYAC